MNVRPVLLTSRANLADLPGYAAATVQVKQSVAVAVESIKILKKLLKENQPDEAATLATITSMII